MALRRIALLITGIITMPMVMADDSARLEQILAGVLEANGGQEQIESARTLRVVGKIETGEINYDFILLKKRPDKVRVTLRHMGRVIDSGHDGQQAWRQTRYGNRSEVEILSPDEASSMLNELTFDGPLIGPAPEGSRRYLDGEERIDRVLYYKIVVESANTRSTHYIDSRTYRELKTVSERTLENGSLRVTTSHYSEYNRLGSIWLAHRIERVQSEGDREVIRVEDAQLNPGIFDSAFAVPHASTLD